MNQIAGERNPVNRLEGGRQQPTRNLGGSKRANKSHANAMKRQFVVPNIGDAIPYFSEWEITDRKRLRMCAAQATECTLLGNGNGKAREHRTNKYW